MHEVYENKDISLFFKSCCHVCGSMLQIVDTVRIVSRGDPDHKKYCMSGRYYTPYNDIAVYGKKLHCSKCENTYTCDEQLTIMNAQKYYGELIISKYQIDEYETKFKEMEIAKVNKYKWFLLIPLLGALVCTSNILNSDLKKYLHPKIERNLSILSVILLLISLIVVKLIFDLFGRDGFMKIFYILPFLLYNVPVLVYIEMGINKL